VKRVLATRILSSSIVCALALSISPFLYGQATGSLSGTVLDKSGASIFGATVTATSQATNLSRNSQTDDVGHYVIPLLSVGMYPLRVAFEGFRTAERKDVGLQIDQARELDFSLAPSSASTTEEVSGSAVTDRPKFQGGIFQLVQPSTICPPHHAGVGVCGRQCR
jgi:Carboxypeptidase regulatory-like domain